MLSSFLDLFGALLVLANLLNEEFRLHFLRNFLTILTYPSTILLHPFLHFPLRCPSAVLCATGRPSTTPSLPPFAIPTADRRSRGTGRHGSRTATVGGHCHLPRNDRLPTLPKGAIGPERVERLSLSIGISSACRKNCPGRWQCNTATMAVCSTRQNYSPETGRAT